MRQITLAKRHSKTAGGSVREMLSFAIKHKGQMCVSKTVMNIAWEWLCFDERGIVIPGNRGDGYGI